MPADFWICFSIAMIYLVAFAAAAVLVLVIILRIKHQKKCAREHEEKIKLLQGQIHLFSTEYARLLKHFVTEEKETEFSAQWRQLYAEVSKCRIPKKHAAFDEIKQFRKTYANLHTIISDSNAEIRRKEEVKNLSEQTARFFTELSELSSGYVTHSAEMFFAEKWSGLSQKISAADIRTEDSQFSEIERFKTVFNSLGGYFETANAQFIQNESIRYDSLFSNIDGKSLDEQQRTAVITDEDRILVLAGAGSGKTLTIAAKVKYLCEVKNVHPNEILLISFTKKSAQEMTERIQEKLSIPCEATTFHKLGLEIIKTADGRRPDVTDENALAKFIHDFFENQIVNHPDMVKALTEYFAYFLEIPDNMEQYDSLGELYEEEKNADLETLKSKYDRETYIRQTGAERAKAYKTLNNEQVKSLEETKIANFLFMHNVRYEYERLYPFEGSDPQRKAYRPDFYLTDYDIYLEHFGISKDGGVPWLSKVEEKKYLDGIKWKRAFHTENKTTLLETYSYYSSEGVLLKKLKELLTENGVKLESRDFTDVFNTVYASKSNKYFSET